jgi:hypothetical protein
MRSAITDDGRAPLSASGIKLLRAFAQTAPLWEFIYLTYSSWVHRAAYILKNQEDPPGGATTPRVALLGL